MRKIFLFLVFLVALSTTGFSQIFNTGQTLKARQFSVGAEPSVIIDGGNPNFMFFGHLGYGLKKGIDIGLKAGASPGYSNYIGGDLEFALGRYFSFAAGAHYFGNMGLDGTLLFTYPIRSDVRISSGFDSDLNFVSTTKINDKGTETTEDDTRTEVTKPEFVGWVPISLEIGLKRNLALIFEVEINVVKHSGHNAFSGNSYHFIGGGLTYYL